MAKKKKKKPSNRTTTKKVQSTENISLPVVSPKPDSDHDAPGDDGLTIRQRLFVEAITGPALGNATKAAEMAGYAPENRRALEVSACRLLGFAKVTEAIAHAFARKRMTPEWAVEAANDLAGSSLANFMSVGDDGKPMLDWKKAAAAGAIGHIREWKEDGIDGPGGPVIIKRSFKLYDKQKALETVLKLHGLLKDITKVEGELVHNHRAAQAMHRVMSDPEALDAALKMVKRLKAVPAVAPDVANANDN